jgi:hypothetical protein
MIHGMNFLIRECDNPVPTLMGFYVNAYVESTSPDDAESRAIELVRAAPKLRAAVTNPAEDRPRLFVTEVVELTDWPTDCALPLSGFVFYDDPDAEWRKEYQVRKLP